MPENIQITTPQVWLCTGILLVMDVVLVLLACRFVSRADFQRLRWGLVTAAGAFFFIVWVSVLTWAWDWFYQYIFPEQLRFWLPFIFLIGYSLVATGMVWLSLKLPGSPAVTWCILGGVEGLLSHLYAIYKLGAASNPPIMQASDPLAVLIFAIFEKAFYWSLILLSCRFILKIRKAAPT